MNVIYTAVYFVICNRSNFCNTAAHFMFKCFSVFYFLLYRFRKRFHIYVFKLCIIKTNMINQNNQNNQYKYYFSFDINLRNICIIVKIYIHIAYMRSGAETARISSAFFNVVLIAIIKASLDFIKSLSSQITRLEL